MSSAHAYSDSDSSPAYILPDGAPDFEPDLQMTVEVKEEGNTADTPFLPAKAAPPDFKPDLEMVDAKEKVNNNDTAPSSHAPEIPCVASQPVASASGQGSGWWCLDTIVKLEDANFGQSVDANVVQREDASIVQSENFDESALDERYDDSPGDPSYIPTDSSSESSDDSQSGGDDGGEHADQALGSAGADIPSGGVNGADRTDQALGSAGADIQSGAVYRAGATEEGLQDNAAGAKTVRVQCSGANKAGRKWDRRNMCVFCMKPQSKLSRHVMRKHKGEMDVKAVVSLPKGSQERKEMFQKIANRGNFLHNIDVLKKGQGWIIPWRRPPQTKPARREDMLPCTKCKGFFNRKFLYKHKCNAGKPHPGWTLQREARKLLPMSAEATQTKRTALRKRPHEKAPWKAEERKVVKRRQAGLINPLRCPRMHECVNIVREEPVLKERSWCGVKCCAYNIIQNSRTRPLGRTSPKSERRLLTVSVEVTSGVDEVLGGKTQRATGKTSCKKKPWTVEEREIVRRRLAGCINALKCPRMHECVVVVREEPALKGRSWRDVKYCAYNIIQNSRTRPLARTLQKSARPLLPDGVDEATSEVQKVIKRKTKRASGKRSCKKNPWTAEEQEILQRRLAGCIDTLRCPRMHECVDIVREEPALKERSWRDVKYCVYNIIQRQKKVAG